MTTGLLNILIVDDHPTMVEAYKGIVSSLFEFHKPEIITAGNCETAFRAINNPLANFDLILLDVILPSYEPQKLFSGEDVAQLAKIKFPNCKIVMLTSHSEKFILYNIVERIKPDGLLVKSDFTPDELSFALTEVLSDQIFYSAIVKQSLKNFQRQDFYLDTTNRQIISLLSKGIQTKNLPGYLGLSISAIDKRKAQIKIFFGVERGTDEDIIREAKKQSYI